MDRNLAEVKPRNLPSNNIDVTESMNEIQLKINKLAQDLIPFDEGLAWYDASDTELRMEIMRALDYCIYQSHPTPADIESGIKKSGLKETYSPCVVIRKKTFNDARQKIFNMPEPDKRRGFRLLLSIFSVADRRRRETQCKEGCSHEWHNIG